MNKLADKARTNVGNRVTTFDIIAQLETRHQTKVAADFIEITVSDSATILDARTRTCNRLAPKRNGMTKPILDRTLTEFDFDAAFNGLRRNNADVQLFCEQTLSCGTRRCEGVPGSFIIPSRAPAGAETSYRPSWDERPSLSGAATGPRDPACQRQA